MPLRGEGKVHNWFWAPEQDNAAFSKEKLVDMYYKSVGRNCNLLIGEVVSPEGLVPESDIRRLKEFGDEIKKRFASPLAESKGTGNELTLKFGDKKKVNHIVIQENIALGERIRSYQVEALVDGSWQKLATGQSVGHKRIVEVPETICDAIRLSILESIAKPQLKRFAAFGV